MKNMFFNYDNKVNLSRCSDSHCNCENLLYSTDPLAMVTNIKGRNLGVQLKHSDPFSLYFHLEDCGTAMETTETSLADLVLSSVTKIEIINVSGKVEMTKEFDSAAIFNTETNDLKLDFSHEESKSLKRESYKLSVKLCWGEDYYEIFTPADGLLIIR